ncbi:protein FAR1-RELATED SEQUENCE [Citrus sinensis]|uniref:Protein FAR1-RELATED SEQUENCE n=1 Tax=Citrus sinensis TaxID=2711 RepID=A0ACB8LUR9_CITSI|nr:protein FAR1-RELATED SEQUENCE [Citrus sinensis]
MEYLENEHAFEELQETRANDVNEIVEPNKCEPALGMLFDNHEEMFAFYKAYGKQEGFPVKVRSTKKGIDGIVKYATFACGRSGKSESKSANALKPKPNVKNGCDAKIGGCLNEDGKWVLRTLNLQHNHGLSPDKARIAQIFNSIVVGAGGYENVTFLEKDCRNFVDKTRRLQLEEGDAMALLKYFKKKQAEYNGFFFSIDLDKEDRLKNVFWADSRSRAAYKYFGDVITFDTTYLTNKYDMSFAPFVGVNHHGQSILLGCELTSREDTETFTWLFEAWLSCMSDSPPLGIITDQDRAMQKAIENIFPTTRHRWSLWHIMKKVSEKLGAFKEREVTRRKGCPPCLRKESSIRKKSVQKNKSAQKNKDLQQIVPSSYHVPNEISTQGSNIATTLQEGSTIYRNLNQCGTIGYYNVPMYQSQFGGSNIYQSFSYNWHTQPVPPYTSQLHYSSPSMTYQGSQSGNFQQLLQQQQRNEDNNDDT